MTTQRARALNSTLLVCLALASIFFVTVMTTSLGLYPLSANLRKSGFGIGEIQGNFASGFEIKSLSWQAMRSEFVAYNIKLKPFGLLRIFLFKELLAETIEIEKLQIRMNSFASQPEVQKPWIAPPFPWILVGKISIQSVEVQHSAFTEPLGLGYFSSGRVQFDGTRLDIGKSRLNSPFLNINIDPILYLQNDGSAIGSLTGALHSSAHPRLKRNITFALSASMKANKIDRFSLTALNDSIRAEQGKRGGFNVSIRNLDPKRYWTSSMPIQDLNLRATYHDINQVFQQHPLFVGKIKLRNREFDLKPVSGDSVLVATYIKNRQAFRLSFLGINADDWNQIKPVFRIEANSKTPQDALAELYFGRKAKQLRGYQVASLANDMQFFQKATTSRSVAAEDLRPATKPKRVLRPKQLPKKLPAYRKL